MITPYYQVDKADIIIHLKVTANAAQNEICGVIVGPDGKERLKVKVTGIADNGKANKSLLKFLSKKLGVAVSNIMIITGKTSSLKKILIKNTEIQKILCHLC